jgi:acetylornithine deacetylase/succinyl-diaminopimelate desuccinylase-like protein
MLDPTSQSVVNHVESNKAELISATQTLVQAASPNPPGNVTAAADAAASLIKKLIPESKVETYETAPGITNVVASISGSTPGKCLVFSGHLDTYPIGEETSWSVPALGGELSEDGKRLYGRGAADMKGGIACSIMAAAALAEMKQHWSGEMVIALAGDEETMGTLGSAYLLDNVESLKCDAMVCGDAGSPLVVRNGEKGLLWVELEAAGRSAHGAHVHKGINAIDRLLQAIDALKSLEKLDAPPNKEVDDVIDTAWAVSEPLGGEGERETLKRITVNVGNISGGTSPNLVPDSAHAAADIRLPVGMQSQEVIAHIHQLMDPIEGAVFRILRSYDPSWTSPTEAIVQHALKASKEIAGSQAVVNMRVGASDSRLFRQRGIPTVVVGLTPYNMGGPDEYLMVNELTQVAQIHAIAALEFLKRA